MVAEWVEKDCTFADIGAAKAAVAELQSIAAAIRSRYGIPDPQPGIVPEAGE